MNGFSLNRILGLGLLLALTSGLYACEKEAEGQTAPDPIQVRYEVLRTEPMNIVSELPGRVSALNVSEVRPQVSGIIKERLFDEGADVKEGQVLYVIDPEVYQAAYNSARAELKRVEANAVSVRLLAERYGRLIQTDAVSRQEYDDAVAASKQADAAVDAAKAALESGRINLSYTKVTSPISGRIGRSFVTPGALVTQNQASPLATVQQLDTVYVDVTQSSADLIKLRRSLAQGELKSESKDSIVIRLKLEDGTTYGDLAAADPDAGAIEGEMVFSDVTVEQSTGVVTVRAKFANPDNVLMPGMYVRAVVQEATRDDAILVPQRAVAKDAHGNMRVFVLSSSVPASGRDGNGTAVAAQSLAAGQFYVDVRNVAIGGLKDERWVIESGLAEGDMIIVDGLQKVKKGDVVRGVEAVSGLSASAQRRLENTALAESR